MYYITTKTAGKIYTIEKRNVHSIYFVSETKEIWQPSSITL